MKDIVTVSFDEEIKKGEDLPSGPDDVMNVEQKSELGEVLDKAFQNSDQFDEKTNMSTIDFWSRIPKYVETFVIRFDSAGQMGIIPKRSLAVTRSAKRIYVSREGAGRKEAVDIIAGKRSSEAETSGFGQLKNFVKSRLGIKD